ncbi:MAG: phosphoglycerate mutase [Comamonas sp.]
MHLLIPHANSAAEPARALWPTLALPHLQALLGRLARQPATASATAEPRLSMPHERQLAERLGLPTDDGRIPYAAWQRWHSSGAADGTPCAVLTLCHWQVTTQHVRLLPPAHLPLTAQEDQALLATLSDFFAPDGLALAATGQPGRWFATGELLRELPCASLDRLIGNEVDATLLGLADHAAARTVRRLQNETQMLLYTHPVNEAREASGMPPVNAFVLSDAGAWQPPPGYAPPQLTHWRGSETAGSLLPPAPGAILQVETLRDAALREDWHGWAAAWQAIDAQLARPEWQAAARHPDFTLTLCGDEASPTWRGQQASSAWGALLQRFKRGTGAAELDWLRQL